MEKKTFFEKARKVLINKYAIAIYVFAVIMIFVGEHSIIQFVKRSKQIAEVESQIEKTNQQIDQAQREMMMLDNTDSLERFARERYMMHADNEDVYIVETEWLKIMKWSNVLLITGLVVLVAGAVMSILEIQPYSDYVLVVGAVLVVFRGALRNRDKW